MDEAVTLAEMRRVMDSIEMVHGEYPTIYYDPFDGKVKCVNGNELPSPELKAAFEEELNKQRIARINKKLKGDK